jgi:hypothetical protein
MKSSSRHNDVLKHLAAYLRLPFAADSIPGAFAEKVLALVYDAEVLGTYDFADVVSRSKRVGWQVKSTKAGTPVTWKRAKIPDRDRLVKASLGGKMGALQALGDAVVEFCNHHAKESLTLYNLDEIRYSRVIMHEDRICYFEKTLVTSKNPQLFDPKNFSWKWSEPRKATKKESLPALHGVGRDGTKWFAAHLLGENQLHFSGEGNWWPRRFGVANSGEIRLADLGDQIAWDTLIRWLRSA